MRKLIIFIIIAVVLIVGSVLGFAFADFLHEQMDLQRYPIKYSEIVENCAREYGVPREMIYAVIHTESDFKEDAVSHVGAKGLMQIIDETNEWIAFRTGEDVMAERIFEPTVNIRRGTWLLSYLYSEFGAWEEALAAYNAGIGRVRGWLDDPAVSSDGKKLDTIPIAETSAYVERVMKAAEKYRALYFE
ncbi:MAG: lytic transglycosylase domain-containing protein [Clostridia bacterium]|nr:lytic transglycosylase domain-containing protein [Clostridia bacterium]